MVGIWPGRAETRDAIVADAIVEDATALEAADAYAFDDELPPPRERWRGIVSLLCLFLGLGWVGFAGWTYWQEFAGALPPLRQLPPLLAAVSAPLVVLLLIHIIVARSHRANAARFTAAAETLRGETLRLDATLAHIEARIAAARAGVAESGEALMAIGEDTANRMHAVSTTLRGEVETIGNHAQALRTSAASARADVAVLLSDLPKAHSESRKMVSALETAGLTAHEAAGKLDGQLAALTARGREADEIAGGAAQKLAAHLARVESVSATAGERLTEASAAMTQSVDAALDHAARASDAARQGLEAQGAAMMALVDQAQAALAKAGAESGEAIAARIGDAHERVEAMAALLEVQSAQTARLIDALREGLDGLDGRFAALDTEGVARSERLAATLGNLANQSGTLSAALETGNQQAGALIGRTETLVTTLDAAAREIDETLPAAFERMDARATRSRALLAEIAPEVDAVESSAGAALDRLMEAEALLAKQQTLLAEFASSADAKIATTSAAAQQLSAELAAADQAARALAEGASAGLVDAMLRVRETAQTASERAKEALARIIPEAAGQLSEAAREALAKTIAEQVGMHIADLTATAERALETAHNASDRLMRQMLTIADTSAAVEARIEEAKAQVAEHDRDNFARRVALLIESLNSTAIDVTKVLSNEVTDAAWAAYLRGDRGVFTRRAVRLLDSSEAREIVRHYDAEPEFREQVNRYIHDFEAMLRNTLATRDGSALSVTLLSSDMGKLYVALAQAIERLRG